MKHALLVSSLCAAIVFAAGRAMAEPANLLGVFKNWSAYSTGSGDTMTCYAKSEPRAKRPATAKRSDVLLLVADWPGRKVKAEPEIVPGYEYKKGAAVTLGVGGDKFEFFSRAGDKSGTAWLRNLKDGDRLIDALSNGVSAVASGTSAKGTKTVDTYSLAGFNEALAKIHAVCNMG